MTDVSKTDAPKTGEPIIKIENVSKIFGGTVKAVDNVNLEVNRGEFFALLGPSGCGKTTFLRVIADLEQATGGTATANGMAAADARSARAYGYVFQAAGLYPWRTIAGNVRLPLEIMGYTKAQMEERVARTLDLVNLTGFERKFPWQLSGGMQQRLAIAQALIKKPKILLLDEPFCALDALTRAQLQDSVMDIHARLGNTVIMITHDVDEAVLLSDRIVMMSNGPAAGIGEIHDLTLSRPRRRLELGENLDYIAARSMARTLWFVFTIIAAISDSKGGSSTNERRPRCNPWHVKALRRRHHFYCGRPRSRKRQQHQRASALLRFVQRRSITPTSSLACGHPRS